MSNQVLFYFKIGLIILFLACLLHMPYGYFQLVRSLGMLGFALFAYESYKNNKIEWMIFWIASSIVINPIIKVALGRIIWNIVDIIWAGVLLYSLVISKSESKSND
ncbi:MAG: hypothetical protein IPG12_03205 [Saprospiraceae bacterium]|nr:hypothetical protein [Saprospiraceae bacterium]